MLSKTLKILGGILAIALLVAGIVGLYVWYSGSKNSEQSEKFARDAMIAIAKTWEAQEILSRYNPKIKDKIDRATLEQSLDTVRNNGGLRNLQNFDGVLLLIKSFEGDPDSTAVYRGELSLEKKEYVMRLHVSKWNGQWYIDQIDLCDKAIPDSLKNCRL